jgi:hypothetical protein
LLPWAAGATLSLVVLALTVLDQSWLERVAGWWPATPDVVADGAPASVQPAPDVAVATAVPDSAPKVADSAPKLPPRIVPISPEGRGTARGTRPEVAGAPDRSLAPRPDFTEPRVVPISLERPQIEPSPAVQLVGAAPAVRVDGVELVDFTDLGADSAAPDPVGLRLFIHYPAAQVEGAEIAARLAEYLRRRGFEVAAIRPIDLLVERPGVRYFFDRDYAESERLLDELGWFFRGMPWAAPARASDFTHYTPRPSPGTVEIWLPAVS